MKLFAFLCLVGVALASGQRNERRGIFDWKTGKTYVFSYTSRQITGLPELATHYSGIGLSAEIYLEIHESNRFAFSIREPRYVKINQRLEESSGDQVKRNWREIEMPQKEQVPQEFAEILSKPTTFEFSEQDGSFRSLTIEEDEPQWSLNFKKALIAVIQTKLQGSSSSLETNQIESRGESDVYETYWKVNEESIDGICETTYQMNELPTYMALDRPEIEPTASEYCQGRRTFEIVKSRDISSCVKRASYFFYKPGHFDCPTGNCDGMWSKSSVTRYIACGESRDNLQIQTIRNEGELQQDLLGFDTEKFLTGIRQVFNLKEIRDGHSVGMPKSPKTLKSLLYGYSVLNQEFSLREQSLRAELEQELANSSPNVAEARQQWASIYRSLPRRAMHGNMEGNLRRSESELIPQMKKLIKELVLEDLSFKNEEDIAEKQVTFKVLNLARGFSLISKSEMEELYQSLKGELRSEDDFEVLRNVFFDTVNMGGTADCVRFIKEKIVSGTEIGKSQMATILMTLPQYILTPSQPVLEDIYEMITSRPVRENTIISNHAMMAFTILLNNACVRENRKTSYPTFVFGEFCQPDANILVGKWIPFLEQETQKTDDYERRHAAIVSLGLVSHRNVISVLVPVVEGKSNFNQNNRRLNKEERDEEEKTRLSRFLAIYSLSGPGSRNPELVIPVVYSVFGNRAESTELRVAAFNTLMKLNPSMAVLHKIAASTWSEEDMEVLKVVNSAFYSLRNEEDFDSMVTTSITLSRKAALVYPLLKQVKGFFTTSATVYTSDFLDELKIGFKGVTSWTSNGENVLPNNFYTRMTYLMDRFHFTPFEFGARFSGIEQIVEELAKIAIVGKNFSGIGNIDNIAAKIEETMGQEWRQVIEQLKIKARESRGIEAVVYMRIMENMPFLLSFQANSNRVVRERVAQMLEQPHRLLEKLQGEKTMNYQRLLDLSTNEFLIPSDMGFPIVIEVHMPVAMSFQGKFNTELSLRTPKVGVAFKALFAAQYTGWVGTLCPFTGEYVLTGIDEHTVINVPMDFSLEVDVPEQKLTVVAKPYSKSSGWLNLLHYHVRPFTTFQKNHDLTPMTKNANTKIIKSSSEEKTLSREFGDLIGLKMKSQIKTESPFVDFRTVIDKLRMFNYNPLNLIRFQWANTAISEEQRPSNRKHEYKLLYNPAESTTREVIYSLAFGCATKSSHESPIQYHHAKAEPGMPVAVHSVDIVKRVHQQRQERIQQVFAKSGVESGVGISFTNTLIFRGSRVNTISYAVNMLGGKSGLKSKWNVNLETASGQKMLCIDGQVQMPSLPLFNVDRIRATAQNYQCINKIGFGHQCEESKIVIEGNGKVSSNQKQYSRESPAARQLENLRTKIGNGMAELSDTAKKVQQQATLIDEIDYRVEYVNVPSKILKLNDYAVQVLKGVWWPYLRANNPWSSGHDNNDDDDNDDDLDSLRKAPNGKRFNSGGNTRTEQVQIRLHPISKTFDLTISQPNDVVVFKGVRVHRPFSYFFQSTLLTSKFGMSNVQEGISSLWSPKCRIVKEAVETFSGKMMHIPHFNDECYHLISADCSEMKSFGVLARSLGASVEEGKEIKVMLGRREIKITPKKSSNSASDNKVLMVFVDGEEIHLNEGASETIVSKDGSKVLAVIERKPRGEVLLRNALLKIAFDGESIEVSRSPVLRNKLCGICGSIDARKGLTGPRGCVFSKTQLFVASYRLNTPSGECKPLAGNIEAELRREQEVCAEVEVIPTQVRGAFLAHAGKCTRHQHLIIEKSDELCFSRKPVTECGPACKVESEEALREKRISFACLPKNRSSERYARMVQDGEILSELENLEETFNIAKRLPPTCVPANRY